MSQPGRLLPCSAAVASAATGHQFSGPGAKELKGYMTRVFERTLSLLL